MRNPMSLPSKACLAALLLATLMPAAGCAPKRRAAAADAPSAHLTAGDVAVAARADLVAGVPVSGTLRPGVEINITSPVADVLEAVPVREGQHVAKGQVLARFRLGALEPDAASATAALKVAQADYERYQNLFKQGAVSQRDVEGAEAQWRAAAAVEAATRRQFEDATVRAPMAGVIATRSVQAGDRTGDGDPLFQLVNTSMLEFEATVPSEYVASVKVGSPVRLAVTGFEAGAVEGHVARVNAAADPATRQVKVYVTVPNRDGRLVGGLFASGAVVIREARAVAAVPAAAVRGEAGGAFALAIRNGRVERRAVTTGVRDAAQGLVEIRSGIAAGDTVVTGLIEGLVAGQSVDIGGKER